MKTALIQADLAWEDIGKNLSNFERLLSKIKTGCDLVLLPEMFSTGFTMNPSRFSDEELNNVPLWMQKIANDKGFALGGSSVAAGVNGYSNRFYFARPDADILFYDKRHLFRMGEEQNHYVAGTERKVFEYNGWRICPQICYDLRFPVWCRNRNDYDVLVFVADWPASRQDIWTSLLKARAIENQCYVIGVNRTGADPNVTYTGGSVVFSPKGEILSQNNPEIPFIVTADISLENLQSFRDKFPVWMDADGFTLIDS